MRTQQRLALDKEKSTDSRSMNRNASDGASDNMLAQRRRSNKSQSSASVKDSAINKQLKPTLQSSFVGGGALNLITIPENVAKQELDQEVIQKFKKHLFSKDFFYKLKLILIQMNRELDLTRSGGAVSNEYIMMKEKNHCKDEIHKLVFHDKEFK